MDAVLQSAICTLVLHPFLRLPLSSSIHICLPIHHLPSTHSLTHHPITNPSIYSFTHCLSTYLPPGHHPSSIQHPFISPLPSIHLSSSHSFLFCVLVATLMWLTLHKLQGYSHTKINTECSSSKDSTSNLHAC